MVGYKARINITSSKIKEGVHHPLFYYREVNALIDQTRFFVTQKYKIAQNVATGIINANDLVITSDTHELFYIDASGNYYPITTTKEELGLGNVTNTKQVNAPTNITPGHVAAWGSNSQTLYDSGYTIASNVPSNAKFTDTTYNVATPSSGGLMSGADKEKLDTIARGAQVNVTYNNATQSTAGLMSAADKTKLDGLENITPVTYENATRTTAGLMSAEDKVKLDDMEQVEPVIYEEATTTTAGLMSAADKTKLNGLENYVLNIQDADVPNTIARKTDLIPSPPSEDGDYTLKASVENGDVIYTWIKETVANNLTGTAVVGTATAG